MTVPTSITDLYAAAASNSPEDSDQAFPDLDNYLRAMQAITRRGQAISASAIASASSIDIGASVDGDIISVTGTTTITALGTVAAGIIRTLIFSGALKITHNATSLIMPDGMNYKTQAGDVLSFVSLGSGNWRCLYQSRKQTEIDMTGVSSNIQLPVGYSAKYTVSAVSSVNLYLTIAGAQHYQISFANSYLSAAAASLVVTVNGANASTDYLNAGVDSSTGAGSSSATLTSGLIVGYSEVRGATATIGVRSGSIRSHYVNNYDNGTTHGMRSQSSLQSVTPTELTSIAATGGTISGTFSIQRIL